MTEQVWARFAAPAARGQPRLLGPGGPWHTALIRAPCTTLVASPSFRAGCPAVEAENLGGNGVLGIFVCLNEDWKICLLTLTLKSKAFDCQYNYGLNWLLSYCIFVGLCFDVYLQELNVLLVCAGRGFCNQFLQFHFRDLHIHPTIRWFH